MQSRLTFLGDSPHTSKNARGVYRCECGVIKTIIKTKVKNNNTLSCGCLAIEAAEKRRGITVNATHGLSKTPTWRVWVSMKYRCSSKPGATGYKSYAGRGIKVCDRWVDSFENFLKDMGEKPEGAQIDRINNDGDYAPDNCRWVTQTENVRNRSNTVTAIKDGVEKPLAEWCQILRLNYDTHKARLLNGVPKDKVFDKPVRKHTKSAP